MKTLNVMDVKEEDVLNRNEMKAIMAGCGSQEVCTCRHNGCLVSLTQYEHSWKLDTACGGSGRTDTGSGQYGGTVCGGECP